MSARGTRRSPVGVVALLAAALAACGPPPADETTDAVPATRVRDSAGVRLVAAGFVRTPLADDERLGAPDTLLDAARDGDVFTGLAAVAFFDDGSLAAFSRSGPVLVRVVPRDGAPPRVDTIATGGPAPGQVGEHGALLPRPGGGAWFHDHDAGRLAPVDTGGVGDGVLLDYPIAQLAAVEGAFADGTIIGYTIAPPDVQGTGLARAPAALLRFHPDGRLRDTLRTVRGPERIVQRGRLSRSEAPTLRTGSVPYGRNTLVAVAPERLLLLDTEGCHVAWHDTTGTLVQRLDVRCTIELVTEQTRARFRAELLRTARSASDSLLRDRVARSASFPPTRATMAALRTDAAARAWLRLPSDADSTASVWWVFDADATPLARVGVPSPWEIVAIGRTSLVAAALDRDDMLPVVVRFPLPAVLATAASAPAAASDTVSRP
jgi:hypothetical protein